MDELDAIDPSSRRRALRGKRVRPGGALRHSRLWSGWLFILWPRESAYGSVPSPMLRRGRPGGHRFLPCGWTEDLNICRPADRTAAQVVEFVLLRAAATTR